MKIEGLPSGAKPLRFALPKRKEKYIDDEGEIAEAGRDHDNVKRLIVELAELPYAERQAAWVKEFDVKVGDKVKVLRAFETGEYGAGWSGNLYWNAKMEPCIGQALEVVGIDECNIFTGTWYWPYFVLKKVTPTTRPMTRDEFLAAWRERGWCPLVANDESVYSVLQVAPLDTGSNVIIRADCFGWMTMQDASNLRFMDAATFSESSPLTVTE